MPYIADVFCTPASIAAPALTPAERELLELYSDALEYIAEFSPGTLPPVLIAQAALRGERWR
jgi:hypothetical protein